MAGTKEDARVCRMVTVCVLCLVVALGGVRGRDVGFGTSSVTVRSAGELYSKLWMLHLTWDLSDLLVGEPGINMDELFGFPEVSIPRHITLSGVGDGSSPPLINGGECAPRIVVDDDVEVEVEQVEVDLGHCGLEVVQSVMEGEQGWLFRLGKGSKVLYRQSRIVMQEDAIKAIEAYAGEKMKLGEPQNFAISSTNESVVVTFVDVVFDAVNATHPVQRSAKLTKTFHVDSSDKFNEVLKAPYGDKEHVDVVVENSFVDVCDSPKRPHVNPENHGYTLKVKSAVGHIFGIGCSLFSFASSVLGSQRLVTVENLLLYGIEHSVPRMPSECRNLECFRHSWTSVFPSISEDYQCHVVVRNSTSISGCKTVALLTQLLDTTRNKLPPIKADRLVHDKYEVPFASTQAVDKFSLKIEKFAYKGLCMEDVLMTCDQEADIEGLSAIVEPPVKTSKVSSILIPLAAAGGVLLFMAIGIGCVWVFLIRTRKTANSKHIEETGEPIRFSPTDSPDSVNPNTDWAVDVKGGPIQHKESKFTETPHAQDEYTGNGNDDAKGVVEIKQKIGAGGYGVVYRAEWKGLSVAVKTVTFQDHPKGQGKDRQRAILEAAISSALAHENIVQTHAYGFIPLEGSSIITSAKLLARTKKLAKTNSWQMFIVQEYCSEGSLRAGLKQKLFTDPGTELLDFHKVLEMALDISRGMEHLHSTGIIHGDLTSKNVLLKSADSSSAISEVTAKIADFGLSVKVGVSNDPVQNYHAGTPFYVAPEVSTNGSLSKCSDVFSFGVLLWELYHQRTSFEYVKKGQYRYHKRFPKFPVQCPMPYALLCIVCLSSDPSNRPDFSFINWALGRLIRMWCRKGYPQDVKNDNSKYAANLEGMNFEDIPSFLENLLEDDYSTDSHLPELSRSEQRIQCNERIPQARLAITPHSDSDALNHLESLGHASYNPLMTEGDLWESQVDEIIAAGVGLSVTVLPGLPEDYDAQSDNWTASTTLSYIPAGPSFKKRRNSSGAGSSNVFSVAVDDGSFSSDLNMSCGELVFKWSPSAMVEDHTGSSSLGSSASSDPLRVGSKSYSMGEEEAYQPPNQEMQAPLSKRFEAIADPKSLKGSIRCKYANEGRCTTPFQASQSDGGDSFSSDRGTKQGVRKDARAASSDGSSSERTLEPIALPALCPAPTFMSENPLYSTCPQSQVAELG